MPESILPEFPDIPQAALDGTKAWPGGRARKYGLQVGFLNLQFPKCPWLLMLLNPDTWNEQYAKRVSTYETRGAWVEEHWGNDELDTITASGYSMLYAYLINRETGTRPTNNSQEGEGILGPLTTPYGRSILQGGSESGNGEFYWVLATQGGRFDTVAGWNEQQLLQMFLNGGAIYNPRGQIDRFTGLMMVLGSDLYIGYMDNIRFSEEASQPWRRSFDFSFKVRFSLRQRSVNNVGEDNSND